MKKIIMFTLLFSSLIYSQALQKLKEIDTKGRPIAEYVTDSSPLPVDATITFDSTSLATIATEITLTLIKNYLHPADKIIIGVDSVATDTLAIDISEITTYAHFSIFPNDTIDISFDETNWMRALPNQSFVIKNFSPITFDTIYIKRRGTDGTAIFEYEVIGY